MNKLHDDLKYEILKFISYFDLDDISPCFRLTSSEQAYIKFKIYKERLVVSKCKGDIKYTIEGQLHREYGPAMNLSNQCKLWVKNGRLHREYDLPAVEYANGSKEWHINGIRHRKNGPALEYTTGVTEWYIDGVCTGRLSKIPACNEILY
jgi:hypothetical protein